MYELNVFVVLVHAVIIKVHIRVDYGCLHTYCCFGM